MACCCLSNKYCIQGLEMAGIPTFHARANCQKRCGIAPLLSESLTASECPAFNSDNADGEKRPCLSRNRMALPTRQTAGKALCHPPRIMDTNICLPKPADVEDWKQHGHCFPPVPSELVSGRHNSSNVTRSSRALPSTGPKFNIMTHGSVAHILL